VPDAWSAARRRPTSAAGSAAGGGRSADPAATAQTDRTSIASTTRITRISDGALDGRSLSLGHGRHSRRKMAAAASA
jgi:hypothetical protein